MGASQSPETVYTMEELYSLPIKELRRQLAKYRSQQNNSEDAYVRISATKRADLIQSIIINKSARTADDMAENNTTSINSYRKVVLGYKESGVHTNNWIEKRLELIADALELKKVQQERERARRERASERVSMRAPSPPRRQGKIRTEIKDCPASLIKVSTFPCSRSNSLLLHPDKNRGCPDLAHRKFQKWDGRCRSRM